SSQQPPERPASRARSWTRPRESSPSLCSGAPSRRSSRKRAIFRPRAGGFAACACSQTNSGLPALRLGRVEHRAIPEPKQRDERGQNDREDPGDACHHTAEGTVGSTARARIVAFTRRLRKDRKTSTHDERIWSMTYTKERAAAAAASARPYVERAL